MAPRGMGTLDCVASNVLSAVQSSSKVHNSQQRSTQHSRGPCKQQKEAAIREGAVGALVGSSSAWATAQPAISGWKCRNFELLQNIGPV